MATTSTTTAATFTLDGRQTPTAIGTCGTDVDEHGNPLNCTIEDLVVDMIDEEVFNNPTNGHYNARHYDTFLLD